MKKQNVRTLTLLICTFTFLLVGAAVFDILESAYEQQQSASLLEMEMMLLQKYNIARFDFQVMETVILRSVPHEAGQQWKFAGALYYAITVLTTIGYGHSTPETFGGKIFTMFYAIIGIPLGLVMFQSIGERLNMFSSIVIKRLKTFLNYNHVEASESDLIIVVTTLSTVIITTGAAVFRHYEGWTYFDSVYYCFITLTTIGFGDMVAMQKNNALDSKPEYMAFSLIFILFGLAVVAASLNLLVLRFVTMNTEDERRDEAEALQQRRDSIRLEGDIITANGSICSGIFPREDATVIDVQSVCSCDCNNCLLFHKRSVIPSSVHRKHRFSINRPSFKLHSTFLPMQTLSSVERKKFSGVDVSCDSVYNPHIAERRVSM